MATVSVALFYCKKLVGGAGDIHNYMNADKSDQSGQELELSDL